MKVKTSFKFQRLVSGVIAFLAFCFIVNGVFGPAWVQHVLSKGGDVWVLEEGVWLAKVCDMTGQNCYMSTRLTAFEHAGFAPSKAGMGVENMTYYVNISSNVNDRFAINNVQFTGAILV